MFICFTLFLLNLWNRIVFQLFGITSAKNQGANTTQSQTVDSWLRLALALKLAIVLHYKKTNGLMLNVDVMFFLNVFVNEKLRCFFFFYKPLNVCCKFGFLYYLPYGAKV